jgi:hypothetical protein
MKISVRLGYLLGVMAFFSVNVHAETWRGIVPLRSTKADVERRLGEPSEATDKLLSYRLSNETILISLITDEVNDQILKPGTVRDIQVMPKNGINIADLGLDEKRIRFVKGSKPAYQGFMGYVDEDAGIIVNLSGIQTIFYFANSKDRARCPSCTINPQSIADIPTCALCPTVMVASPDEIQMGDPLTFIANIGPGFQTTYKWTVNEGRIAAGQGTASIVVDTTKLEGKTITATIEVIGMEPACPKTSSSSTQVVARKH